MLTDSNVRKKKKLYRSIEYVNGKKKKSFTSSFKSPVLIKDFHKPVIQSKMQHCARKKLYKNDELISSTF